MSETRGPTRAQANVGVMEGSPLALDVRGLSKRYDDGTVALDGFDLNVPAGAFFGLLGYVLVKLRFEPAPLLLGFVLGPLLEENLRRAMILSRGDPMTFVERPISLGLLVASALVLALVFLPQIRQRREEVFTESDA